MVRKSRVPAARIRCSVERLQIRPRRFHLLLATLPVALAWAGVARTADAPLRMASAPVGSWLRLAPAATLQEVAHGVGASAAGVLERGQPLALTSGDLDADGVADLVAAYGTALGGGWLVVWKGNVDSVFPNTPAAAARRAAGTFRDDPFLGPVATVEVPCRPDLLGAGDLDADGHPDLVVAERDRDRLWLVGGDGRGGLGLAAPVDALGAVTALAVGEVNRRDGLADVVAGVETSHGPRLLVFEGPKGALRHDPEILVVPGRVTDVALGQLDDDAYHDVAAAAGLDLLVVRGRDRRLSQDAESRERVAPAEVDGRAMPTELTAVSIGDFSGDHRRELAALDAGGRLALLTPEARVALDGWRSEELGGVASSSEAILVRGRCSFLPKDDLLVLAPEGEGLQVVNHVGREQVAGAPASAGDGLVAAGVDGSSDGIAVLPMRLNVDALDDLVVLCADGTIRVHHTTAARSFVVDDPGDDMDSSTTDGKCLTEAGKCTLRAALQETNRDSSLAQVTFAVGSVNVTTNLPPVQQPVTIDGTSRGRVQVNGEHAALSIQGGDSVVRGLSIPRIDLALRILEPRANSRLEGNSIGVASDGSTPLPASGYRVLITSVNNVVGGTAAAARNVISGGTRGVQISSSIGGSGNRVEGNFIGTDATGSQAVPNQQYGVSLEQATSNVIGGTAAGAGNLISGNGLDGVRLTGSSCTANLVQGNVIGLDHQGQSMLPNQSGVTSSDNASGTTIGGTAAGARNLISGNQRDGVSLAGGTHDTLVQGNVIGTDAAGGQDLGNQFNGVRCAGVTAVNVGGTVAGAGNLISGNDWTGVAVISGSAGVRVQGNHIGTDASGTAALGNGTAGSASYGQGVWVQGSDDVRIGGPEAGAGNLVSGNLTDGVEVSNPSATALTSGIRVDGNRIGVGADGSNPLPNGTHGVSAVSSLVAVGLEAPNIVAHNTRSGVVIGSTWQRIKVRRNQVFANGWLGIDVGGNGSVEQNDPDDTYLNGQNHPVLASVSGGTLSGTLQSRPGVTFVVDVYANGECDPSGHGEGRTWLGETTATTDSSGLASFSFGIGGATGYLTATATHPEGSTSEFSACLAVEPDTTDRGVRITPSSPTVEAGKSVALQVEVVKQDGTVDTAFSGAVSVSLAAGSTASVGALIGGDGVRRQQTSVAVSQGRGSVSLATPAEELTAASVLTPSTVLEGTAVVRAELDADTSATTTVQVTSPLDLRIERIEVQQGMRVTPNELDETFVRNRKILIRMYVGSNGAEFALYDRIEGLAVELTIRDGNGAVLHGPARFNRSVRATGSPFPQEYVHRRSGSFTPLELLYGVDSMNALWPATTDKLTVEARLAPDFADRDRSNDGKSLGPLTFVLSDPVTILWSRTRFESSDTVTAFPSMQGISRQMGRLFDTYPLSDGHLTWLEQPNQVVSNSPLEGGRDAALARWLSAADDANVIAWVHFVDGAFISKVKENSRAWGYAHLNGHVAVVNSETALPPENTRGIAAHEVGHLLGLGDTYFSPRAYEILDINPRRADATRNGNRVEAGAFHFWNQVFEVDGDQYQMIDLMGNDSFSWYDEVTLRYLQDAFLPVASGGARPRLGLLSPHRAAIAAEDLVLVRGVADPDGSVELSPFYTLHAAGLRSDTGSGRYEIATLDGGGTPIDSVRLEPVFFLPNVGVEAPVPFEVALPLGAGVRRVRVRRDQTTVAEVELSTTAPSVALGDLPSGPLGGSVEVGWSGSDPDGDALVYSLFYSPDGAVKMPVVVETASTTATWTVDDFPSGPAPILVVVASDGTRSAEARSAVLDVPDRGPVVMIESPADGMRIRSGDTIVLSASVLDPERGLLPLAEVRWQSDRDGALGTGTSLEVEGLSLGRHTLTASFTDDAGSSGADQVTVEVTDGAVCTLNCDPVVPGTTVVGTPTAVDAGVEADACVATPTVLWSFGDEETSNAPVTSHAWAEPGTYAWRLGALADGVECSASGTITVSGGEAIHHILIPAAAHAPGVLGTRWVTDAVLHNPGDDSVFATVSLHERNKDNSSPPSRSFSVAPGASLELADIVLEQFGLSSAAAALRVGSSGPLVVSSRTYNDAASGTYGQFIPGFSEEAALAAGQEARLIQLTRNSSFRTNIGLASASGSGQRVTVRLYRSDGSLLGQAPYDLPPYGHLQATDLLGQLGATDVADAYAVVRSDTPGARYFVYASVVDNGSGDPVYIYPVEATSGSGDRCSLETWEDLNPGGAVAETHFGGAVSGGGVHLVMGSGGAVVHSEDGEVWTAHDSGTGGYLTDGVWSGSRFVVVGMDGAVATSPDGITWTPRSSGTGEDLYGVAWGAGLFVAVGNRDTLLTSPDGVAWTPRSTPTDGDLWGVSWNGSVFAVVGPSPSWPEAGTVLTSPNGISWTRRDGPAMDGYPYRVEWVDGRFLTVGLGGYFATSPDGVTWTAGSPGSYGDLLGIAWDGSQVVLATSVGGVLSSPDLETWTWWKTVSGGRLPRLQAILWTGRRFVAAGTDGVVLGNVCSGGSLAVATSANLEGLNGTRWTTDLELHNQGTTASSVRVELLRRDQANPSPEGVSVSLDPGESLRLANPLQGLFSFSGAAALRITPSGGEVAASSRTYNTAASGTFGQFIPGTPVASAVEAGEQARLVQLSRSADRGTGFRTNLGFVNLADVQAEVLVRLYRGNGTLLGQTGVTLGGWEHRQLTDVFGLVTAGDVDEGYAVLTTSSPGARFVAYASVVDNRSGDPIYIPAVVVP